jgi:hypothetical protein
MCVSSIDIEQSCICVRSIDIEQSYVLEVYILSSHVYVC